jgi:hypothetical protein
MSGFFPQKQEINTSKCTGIFHRAFVLLKLNPNIESKGKHSQKYFVLQISMATAKLLTQKLLKQGYVSPRLS